MKQYFYSRDDRGSLDELNRIFCGDGSIWIIEHYTHLKWIGEDLIYTEDRDMARAFKSKMDAVMFMINNQLGSEDWNPVIR